jgi:uncharacterized membrane protein
MEEAIISAENVMVPNNDDQMFDAKDDVFDIDVTSSVNFTHASVIKIQKEYDDASSLTIISCVESSVLITFELISNYLSVLLLKKGTLFYKFNNLYHPVISII